ncbi:MAG: response regulator, partial [Anaerolineae bacterium]
TLRDIPIGALGLIDDASREWTDDDLAIIEAVSAQAALAVENARLIEETRRWVLQLQTSAEISQSITATLNLDTLISSSVNLVRFKFNFAAVYLYLIDDSSPNRRILLYRSDAGGGQSAVPVRVALYRNSLTQQALLKAQTLVAQKNNPALHALLPDDPPHIKSALAIPLSVRQKSLGTLEMYSPQNNAFEQDNVAVLELLASQIATSISNALAYQEQQDIAEKLREVDRLKTQFLANMSHELRTPLNSIIGFSRVILKGIDGPLTELQKTDLTSIHQSGKHLLDLINNILDLSKIEAGKLELSFEPVNLKTLIGGITSTAIGLVKDKGLEIIELVPDELPLVEMDETRIRQVLLNLISNAAKFTQQGRITIKVRCDDNRVKISVSDTGIGIAPADQQTIFDEFTQIDASTTRKAGGTGLGLPISRKFVELHRGQIQVESRLNAGSTFTVELPISQSGTNGAQAKPARPPLPAPAPHPRSTLLVVDSDPRIVSYYQQYLQGEAITIKHLGRGEEALAAAKKLQPKAIMLDVLLPDADGWTILGALKENPHTAHIPVIICSIIEDRYRATKLGAADYLVKPVIKRDLLHMLQKLDTQKQHPNRVLVIDDQAEDILLIRRILEAHDCQVVEARNGLEGLDIIFSNPPDLVMLDLTMPGLDGFGVLESLKSNPKTGNIPVVVITAKELTAAERKTVDRQADALLQKGKFTDSDLLRHVNRFFERVAI